MFRLTKRSPSSISTDQNLEITNTINLSPNNHHHHHHPHSQSLSVTNIFKSKIAAANNQKLTPVFDA